MNRDELPIEKPCDADWSTMTLADRGRFCGSCAKVVRELTQLTEVEARALLASPPTEGLCVRYVHDATGAIVFRPEVIPVARLARGRRVAAAALAAASLAIAAGCAEMPAPVAPVEPPMVTGMVTMGAPPAFPMNPPPTTTGSAAPVTPPGVRAVAR